MDPRFSNLIEKNGILNFKLEGINVSLANAVRRTLLTDIDTVVFRTFPHTENQADILVNTTRFNNEILKQRLGCIPIHIQDTSIPIEQYVVEVHKKNETDTIQYVTTADFKVKKNGKNSKNEKSELNAKEKFVLSISENGYGKKTSHFDYRVTNRGGKGIIGIINSPRNGNITSSFPVYDGDEILISTNKGRVIRVAVKEIRTAGRNTQGVRIIKLSGDEKVVSAIKIDDNLI